MFSLIHPSGHTSAGFHPYHGLHITLLTGRQSFSVAPQLVRVGNVVAFRNVLEVFTKYLNITAIFYTYIVVLTLLSLPIFSYIRHLKNMFNQAFSPRNICIESLLILYAEWYRYLPRNWQLPDWTYLMGCEEISDQIMDNDNYDIPHHLDTIRGYVFVVCVMKNRLIRNFFY